MPTMVDCILSNLRQNFRSAWMGIAIHRGSHLFLLLLAIIITDLFFYLFLHHLETRVIVVIEGR